VEWYLQTVRARPEGVHEDVLAEVIADRWGIEVDSLSYEALGGGSHHWLLRSDSAGYRFLTVDDLGTKPWLGSDHEAVFAGLEAAYGTARRLRDSGLDFVVAPIRAADGSVVTRFDDRHSVALFPYIAGRAGTFGEAFSLRDRNDLGELWARLHLATAVVRDSAPHRSLEVPGRAKLEDALAKLDGQWSGGPYSEPTRQWLLANRDLIRAALDRHDRQAAGLAGKELVVTHGEPHGGNLIRTEDGLHLVDWDTVAMAPPERDLWMLDDGLGAYVEATGRQVDRAALEFYRLAWLVTDAAAFVDELRRPHSDDADTVHAWRALEITGTSLRSLL
jgi:spectinomycin phosphotransferase